MDPEKPTELFVPTQLNYVHFDETPDLYKHTEKSRIYFYNSEENKCDNLIDCVETSLNDSGKESSILITSSTVNLPINALCKSSSSESDACSSTRLLDNHIDDSVVGYEMTFKSDKFTSLHHHHQQNHPHHPNPLTTMIEMSNKYQVSDISYTDLKPASPVTLTSSENETFWSKVHSSMSSNIRRRYLDSHRANESSPSSTGQSSVFGCPISKTRFSLILICTLLTSAFAILFFGLLTLSEFPLWNNLINFHPFKFGSHGYSSSSLSSSSGSTSLSTSSLYGSVSGEGGGKWWHDALVYEIFAASFKDSDSDGFGDIKGIHEKLPYLRDLGVTVIRLNPIFHALDYPYSYENVVNFTRLDPHLGDIDDLVNLVTDLHTKGMKLILDINLSITSDQHPWVANWLANSSSTYNYHYINTSVITPIIHIVGDTNHPHPPNHNHLSHYPFGGYFYLNWSNPVVQSNMINCLQFWLQHGVDGFYLLNINEIYIDPEYPEAILEVLDSIRSHVTTFRSHSWPGEKILLANRQSLDTINERLRSARADQLLDHLHHPHHHDNLFPESEAIQPDDYVITRSRKRIKSSSSFRSTNNNEKNVYAYFDLVNIFLTIELNSSEIIRDQVNGYFLNTPKSRPWVLWSIGSVTRSRLATRIGKEYTLVSTFLLVMLPGSINFFYGDEIGLTDAIDPSSGKEYTGGQLCPIPWTSELNGNFSTGNSSHPWLPVNSNYLLNNIQRESETINRLQQLIGFRQYNLRSGWTEKQGNYLFHYVNEGFLALERYFTRTMVTGSVLRHRFVLFANIGTIGRIKDFTDKFHFGTIKVTSNPKRIQDFLYLRSFQLEPGEALIAEME